MEVDGVNATPPANAGAQNRRDDPAKVRGAARDFESLLVSQMLRSMREGGGWLGTGEDQAGGQAMDFAEEQFARALSASGGLGLSGMIMRSLDPAASSAKSSTRPPDTSAAPPAKPNSTES